MIETVEAVENLDEIVSTPGIDAVYVGPADLGITMGLGPTGSDGDERFDNALAATCGFRKEDHKFEKNPEEEGRALTSARMET